MKVSTRSRYGLKALLEIATAEENKCVSLQAISDKSGISVNYLEQIIATLKKAGIVKSIRGAKGGYVIGKKLEDISLGEVIRVLEGDLMPVSCIDNNLDCVEDTECSCGNKCTSGCLTKDAWIKVYSVITESIDGISIRDIVEKNL
ncbi:MAG: RrF2 family transcriptional regulator [Lachnospirales bacterium]